MTQLELFPADAEPVDDIFGEVIYAYTRQDAIEDGFLVDAMQGPLADVSRQHFRYPIAMTAAVFALIEKAVDNEKYLNDFAGVWHDILWMSKTCAHRSTETTRWFKVIITGTGRRRYHELKIVCGPGDDAEPVLTVMLPEED